MTPNDFIDWADGVAQSAGPAAAMRSATSRACYGAFHLAKEWLGVIGIHPRKGDNEHAMIQRYFLNCTQTEAVEVGGLLGNLHEARKEADYHLSRARSETTQFAQDSVARAKLILEKLAACSNAGAAVKQQIEDYRKKINA